MKTPSVFTPGMLDVLRELMNIGVGRAARAIAELSGREVVLRVLEIEVLDLADSRQLADLRGQINLRVSQAFSGGLEGCGLFALSRSGAIRLAQLVLGKAEDDVAFDELDQGALLELGNVVISSAVGMLASELAAEVRYELPQLQLRGIKEVADLFADVTHADQTTALVMRASLSLRGDMVNGYLVLFFPGTGLQALTGRLSRLAP
jgi:chemotaxis protein CheC